MIPFDVLPLYIIAAHRLYGFFSIHLALGRSVIHLADSLHPAYPVVASGSATCVLLRFLAPGILHPQSHRVSPLLAHNKNYTCPLPDEGNV